MYYDVHYLHLVLVNFDFFLIITYLFFVHLLSNNFQYFIE